MQIQQAQPRTGRWGGARSGAGRKPHHGRAGVPHRPRRRFRGGTLHVTVRVRREIWSLRGHRCFRALRRSFARGCERFGFRLIHFSVQGNHAHFIVEAPDAGSLGRAMKGLEVRMARALNKVMSRKGAVFADRYTARLLTSTREASYMLQWVRDNRAVHALQRQRPVPQGLDPRCSCWWRDHWPPLTAQPRYWLLRAGVEIHRMRRLRAAA